jgi:uncharacterized membrane protein YoaK (UPF0700 family)
MLQQSKEHRTLKNNLLLAASTALAAGMTNVAGMMACYSFTSNVTGHSAAFAQHLVKGNWFDVLIALTWLFMFFTGAFTSNFIIQSVKNKSAYLAHSIPLIIEIIIIATIGVYGIFNNETEMQTEAIAAALLFAMGLQNSTVSTISGGSIKTSHLTGLFTDLGGEVSEWLHPKTEKTDALRNKLRLRFSILLPYLIGAFLGGFFYINFNFHAFFIIAIVLFFIVFYDLIKLFRNKIVRNRND